MRLLAGVAIATTLSSCVARTGTVTREMVLPPGATTHALQERQRFLMAVPVEDPMPAFPSDLPAPLRRHAAVCASFVVTGDGDTTAIAVHPADADCSGSGTVDAATHARLRDSVAQALARWRWFGAAVCTFPEHVAPDDDCRAHGVAVEPVAIRLDYRFVFDPAGHASATREGPPATAPH